MDIYRLGNLQLSLFLLILIGLYLRKKNIVDEPGKRCLTDVCVYVIIPCNIIKSCLMPFEGNIFLTCGRILGAGAVLQVLFMILNHFLFNRYPDTRKRCSSTAPWCPTAAFWAIRWRKGSMGTWGCSMPLCS